MAMAARKRAARSSNKTAGAPPKRNFSGVPPNLPIQFSGRLLANAKPQSARGKTGVVTGRWRCRRLLSARFRRESPAKALVERFGVFVVLATPVGVFPRDQAFQSTKRRGAGQ